MDIAIPMNASMGAEAQTSFENEIRDDTKKVSLNMLRDVLDEAGISYDHSIEKVGELKRKALKGLSKEKREKIEKRLSRAENEVLKLVDTIETSANTKLENFIKLAKENLADPIAKKAVLLLTTGAMSAVILSMPAEARVITGVAGVSGLVYKGAKGIIKNKQAKQSRRYDNILRKLSETTDENGNVIDTRFQEPEIDCIDSFFEKMGTKLDTSSYERMMAQVQELKNDKKLELIKAINTSKGSPLDISEELKTEKKNEKLAFLKNLGIGAAAGSAVGSQVGATINTVDESLVPSATTGILAKLGISKLTKSNFIQNIGATLTAAGTKILTYIPVIGETIKDAYATTTLAVTTAAGAIAGLAVASAKQIVTGSKKIYDGMKELSANKKHEDMDKQLHDDELTDNQMAMLNVVKTFLTEKGVQIGDDIKTVGDLKNEVSQLSDEDKKSLKSVMSVIERALKEKNADEIAKGILDMTATAFSLGATGVAIKDIVGYVQGFIPSGTEEVVEESGENGFLGDVYESYDNTMRKVSEVLTGQKTVKGTDGGSITTMNVGNETVVISEDAIAAANRLAYESKGLITAEDFNNLSDVEKAAFEAYWEENPIDEILPRSEDPIDIDDISR